MQAPIWVRPYYAARRAVSWSADRVAEWCDRQTRLAYGIRALRVQRRIRATLQATASLARTAGLLPRLDSWQIDGSEWRVVYVGMPYLLEELQAMLFDGRAGARQLERVAAWELPARTTAWLTEVDLVVCGLPTTWPSRWRPVAAWTETVPSYVDVAVDLTAGSVDALLRGGDRAFIRQQVNGARRVGFEVRRTTARDDLQFFNEVLYRPHLAARHGTHALVSTPDQQWHDWMQRGGELLLLELQGVAVAGVLVARHGTVAFYAEEGVAPDLAGTEAGRRAQVALKVAALQRALELGCTELRLGRSPARLADGVLAHKLRWGGQVRPAERSIYPDWTFAAASLPAALADRLTAQRLLVPATRGGAPGRLLEIPAAHQTIGERAADR